MTDNKYDFYLPKGTDPVDFFEYLGKKIEDIPNHDVPHPFLIECRMFVDGAHEIDGMIYAEGDKSATNKYLAEAVVRYLSENDDSSEDEDEANEEKSDAEDKETETAAPTDKTETSEKADDTKKAYDNAPAFFGYPLRMYKIDKKADGELADNLFAAIENLLYNIIYPDMDSKYEDIQGKIHAAEIMNEIVEENDHGIIVGDMPFNVFLDELKKFLHTLAILEDEHGYID